jgi:hypothetical protein
MALRFSLKWLLAAMAYVAFVLAAVLQQGEVWANLLWLVNGSLLLVLVLVVACYRGQSQVVAFGFLLFFTASILTQAWLPERSPSRMVKVAAGVGGREFDMRRGIIEKRLRNLSWEHTMSTNNAEPQYRARVERELSEAAEAERKLRGRLALASCIDLLGGMASGLFGAVVGAFGWRRAQQQSSSRVQ